MNNTWMVAWTHQRQRYVLDVDTSGMAAVVGILLTETGRTGVTVNERPWELDEATQKRIRERVFAKAREIPAVFE